MQTIQPAGTFARHLGDGYVRTTDGGAWLYWQMPSQPPVHDAAGWADRIKASRPLTVIMPRLADLAPKIPLMNRKALKGFYRKLHILAIATPQPFQPSPTLDDATQARLLRDYGQTWEHDRFTLIGIELNTGTGKQDASPWHRLTNLIMSANIDEEDANGGPPDQAFDTDRELIARILKDAGCTPPANGQMQRALAWWQTDRKPETVPIMVEHEHCHTFPSLRACRLGEDFKNTRVDCTTWGKRIPGSYPITFATLGALPFDGQNEHDEPDSDWAATLMASTQSGGQGAIALSIRGLVEPGAASREQIDRDKENVLDKAMKQAEDGRKTNLKVAGELEAVDDAYQADGKPWPTLIDARVHVAIPDVIERASQINYPGEIRLNPDRQDAVFQDMMIGSTVRYNPSPLYWPTPILAYAGVSGRSVGGEDMGLGRAADLPGALLGMSETDRQPVYVSPTAVSQTSKQPILACVGQVGSGKTYTMLHLACQWSMMPNPDNPRERLCGVFFNPKPVADDFGPFVRSQGGREYRLDDPSSEGILDPVRCMSHDHDYWDDMVNTAVEMLSQITGQNLDYQGELMAVIAYGLRRGADCTGEAVRIAYEDHRSGRDGGAVSDLILDLHPRLERLAASSALFRIIYATRHGGARLNASQGITLISAGGLNVIPEKQSTSAPSMIQRWVVRMAALGAAGAIIGRNGFVVIDEAWALLGDAYGAAIFERFGRLARAQKYLPIAASQKVDEFVDAGVSEYISRGLILGLPSRNEQSGRVSQAQAACMLFNQPTDGRLHARLTHEKVLDMESNEPDWDSLYALADPRSGRLLRGPVAYYVGLDGHAIPVEVRIPDTEMRLIKGASTRSK